jgi:hypothetical protein
VGHDPKRVLTLCSSHHDDRHKGLLVITFVGDEPRFSLADGAPIGRVSRDAGRDSREADAAAEIALRRLEFKASEAKALVAAARRKLGAVASPEDLVAHALRAVPVVAS